MTMLARKSLDNCRIGESLSLSWSNTYITIQIDNLIKLNILRLGNDWIATQANEKERKQNLLERHYD